jgi:hypothetical protein
MSNFKDEGAKQGGDDVESNKRGPRFIPGIPTSVLS